MKEWKLCKCFLAFNTVHGKSPPAQTLTQCRGLAGGSLPLGNFMEGVVGGWGEFSDHDDNFTGGNFPFTI